MVDNGKIMGIEWDLVGYMKGRRLSGVIKSTYFCGYTKITTWGEQPSRQGDVIL